MNAKRVVANMMVATVCCVWLAFTSCNTSGGLDPKTFLPKPGKAKESENTERRIEKSCDSDTLPLCASDSTEIEPKRDLPNTDESNKTETVERRIEKSHDHEGLEFWTPDVVFDANPRLVRLMDALYRYTRSDGFDKADLTDNVAWMDDFTNQLCDYYYYTRSDKKNAPTEFVMADSVIAEARRLYALSDDESTMGVVVNNNVEWCYLTFEQYNEYSRLLRICKNTKQIELLSSEFQAWIQLMDVFTDLYCDCVDLCYWGGSICSVMASYGGIEILKSHLELYRSEYSLLNDTESASPVLRGAFLKHARTLLFECCKQALTEYYQEGEDYGDLYEQTLKSAKKAVSKLSKAVDNWIAAREQWGDEVCTDSLHPTYPLNTAGVLISLANIISSIK